MIRFTRTAKHHWVYWGAGDDRMADQRRLTPFWFRMDEWPFWAGSGWRWRLWGDVAVHVGRARRLNSHEAVLGGRRLEVTPEEVGEWDGVQEVEEGHAGATERAAPEHR